MTQLSSGLLIALSAGGNNDELATHGLGVEHVEELMVRLSMKLLKDGHGDFDGRPSRLGARVIGSNRRTRRTS